MANLTSVGVTSGVPTSGTGTVSTIDQLLAVGTPISDGTTNLVAVKAASTAAVATDKALVVAVSPNNTVPVSLASVPSHAVTNAGTFAVQVTSAPSTAVTNAGTFATQSAQSGTWNVTNVSGTVSLPTGASTSALQPTNAAIGSTTSGQTGHVVMGATTTASPTYTTAQSNPLSLDTAGNLRVNVVTGATSGTVAQGSTTSGQQGSLIQGAVTTASPTYTTAQTSPLSLDTTGALRVNVTAGGAGGGIVTNAGTFAVQNTAATPAGTNLIGKIQLGDGTTSLPILAASSGSPATSVPALAVSMRDANANGQATMANSAPVVIASNQSAIPVSSGITATANGGTASRVNSAASTNATSLKASAGQIYTIDVFNNAAYNVFLKLYNKASAPTVGTDTPVMTIPVQAGGGYSKTWPMGLPFATGIAYAITKLQADSDTTVVVAGDLTGNTLWI